MNSKKSGKFSGKGYYIALILCAIAIGISGYMYYRNTETKEPSASNSPAGETLDNGMQAAVVDPTDDPTEPTTQTETKPLKTAAPLSGATITEHAIDCLSYNQTTRDWRTHDGIDIAAVAGTEVCAAADGVIYTVYDDEAMGKTVVIRHDGGYITTYASLDAAADIQPGIAVKCGQVIGAVGSSALMETALGDHLHFSVSCNGISMDPAKFLNMN